MHTRPAHGVAFLGVAVIEQLEVECLEDDEAKENGEDGEVAGETGVVVWRFAGEV